VQVQASATEPFPYFFQLAYAQAFAKLKKKVARTFKSWNEEATDSALNRTGTLQRCALKN
jgi:hypothetical protein